VVAWLHRHKATPLTASEAADASDARLVANAQRDPHAFEALYRRYLDEIGRFCYARVRDEEWAQDVTQQTFARALTALPAYREQGQFRGWLYAIARSVIANDARITRRYQTLETANELISSDVSPEEAAIAALSHEALTRAIARLPDDQRDAISLRIAGLTGVEIATAMGRSHDSVRMLQRRAIDRLRRELVSPGTTMEARRGS
jgi:RNA polymerase sigma-70 factor (ECF subfamily)